MKNINTWHIITLCIISLLALTSCIGKDTDKGEVFPDDNIPIVESNENYWATFNWISSDLVSWTQEAIIPNETESYAWSGDISEIEE
jgi:hypothetical protein